MIKLYIPRKRSLFSNQLELVNQEGHMVYRYHSSLFQTKRFIENSENEVIANSYTDFGMIEQHVISQNNEIVAYVSYKSIWRNKILISKEGYSVKINNVMRFTIFNNLEEVLSIRRSDRKGFSCVVEVKEEQTDFLIILMFTILVMIEGLEVIY